MKRIILFLTLFLSVSTAFAVNRLIPKDMVFVQIREIDLKKGEIKLIDANDGMIKRMYKAPYTFKITNILRIKDDKGRWITRNRLSTYKGRIAGVRFSRPGGMLSDIVILADDEVEKNFERMKAQQWKGETVR